ncbi:MAG TPA: DUF362 domain-containing protein [Acidobacteriota bacterium]|nr:DUF362 domain-containing protein [Acidobacteriota bacterium]
MTTSQGSVLSRRAFLLGAGSGVVAGGLATWGAFELHRRSFQHYEYVQKQFTGTCVEDPKPLFALPGRYPGKVVEVNHPLSVSNAQINRDRVRTMIERGMMELTGAPDATQAWSSFFQKGDRVGIKVNPVGCARKPGEIGSISSYAVIMEVVEGLKSAGLEARDIILFERYAREFRDAAYHRFLETELPEVGWYAAGARPGDWQIDLEGRDAGRDGRKPDADSHVLGYDPNVYQRFDYTHPLYDPSDGLSYQSHITKIVTGDLVNKIINIPTLKDHASAGITVALKNLSHGLVSNVSRTHAGHTKEENRCGTFIPQIVALRPIREKVVLHIADGLIGVYEGGPGSWKPSFRTWEYKSLLFATDPVATDHVSSNILNLERMRRRWAPVDRMGVADSNPRGYEAFFLRQPEHVELAGMLNLGVFDPSKIEYRRISLRT